MAINFSSLTRGIAQAGAEDLGRRQDLALLLKLQNRLIESRLASEQAMFDYKRVEPETAQGLYGALGMELPQGKRPALSEESAMGLMSGLGKAHISASARAGRGGTRYDRQALIGSVLKNPEIFDSLPVTAKADIFPDLQKGGFKYLGKPLTEGLQNRADSANSGLRAVERINLKLARGSSEFQKLYAPGSIGAKELRTDLNELMDVVTRIRTGAALNKDEQTFYRAQIVSDDISSLIDDVIDGKVDASIIDYRINTVYKPYLQELSTAKERRKTSAVETPGQKKEIKPSSKTPPSGKDKDDEILDRLRL